ncbi:hypothetical protein [Bradyrhizobium sp. Tv2a-2]|uniref:DUF6894 family protein n=1 Tax=Bradyrhizobium sp. Tv2a-2 TaxID=113395 RepID=UPI000418477C|nr:hypothetical protein [Bradyrhizobium sp. Tv2a-2]
MSLYHFDLANTKTIEDKGTFELDDDIEALDLADLIARRILRQRPERKNRHYFIIVTDEAGEEIVRVPLEIIH